VCGEGELRERSETALTLRLGRLFRSACRSLAGQNGLRLQPVHAPARTVDYMEANAQKKTKWSPARAFRTSSIICWRYSRSQPCAAGRDGGAYDVFFRRPEPERALVAIQHVRHVFRIPPTMFCAHARGSTGCVRHGGRRAHRSRSDRSCARPPAPRASPTRRRPRRGRRGARWHSQSL
jgi:hypothetical protein